MKKFENHFTVTGIIGRDAEIRQFTTASVARFSLALSRKEKDNEESWISTFINIEAWRKNERTESFAELTKGNIITVEGYFKPDMFTGKDGQTRHVMVMVATKFYTAVEQEEKKKPEKKGKTAEATK